jgi:endonuclease YncB( thermonuclease family)
MRRILCLSLVLLAALPACAAEYPARVVGVSDGDTLTVLKADRTRVKVRLWGVDAPESGQDFGSRAKQAASALAFGKAVTVRERDRDRYGRTVAEVTLPDGRSLGRELVRAEMAWWYRNFAPYDRELARSEDEARAAKVGLWGQPGAVPPWEWRKGEGMPETPGVVANVRTGVYHRPSCPGVARMSGKNRAEYGSAAEAERAGYRRAKDCG